MNFLVPKKRRTHAPAELAKAMVTDTRLIYPTALPKHLLLSAIIFLNYNCLLLTTIHFMLDLDDITYVVVGYKSFSRSLFKIL